MGAPISYWIFTPEQYSFLTENELLDDLGLTADMFHQYRGNYYIEAELFVFDENDWEDFLDENGFTGNDEVGDCEYLWSQTPWRVPGL